jgi:septal ring factor EnvC (AmiA/AmiB activator)
MGYDPNLHQQSADTMNPPAQPVHEIKALRDRVREQQVALADLAIERREERGRSLLLTLEIEELKHTITRLQLALDRRAERLEMTQRRLRRALSTARGAHQALARHSAERMRPANRPTAL